MNNLPDLSFAMPAQTLISVFSILNEKKIRYCSWKSNLNLFKSFQCETDIDLLVSPDGAHDFQQIIRELGIIQRFSTPDKTYPGMEDYLGIDAVTGKMFHLHVHYKLIIGKKFQKNYRIPIETLILNTSIWDSTFPVRIIKPELELLLLIVRIFLKLDGKSLLLKNSIPKNIREEYRHLTAEADKNEFFRYTGTLLPELSVFFKTMLDTDLEKLSGLQLHWFKSKVKNSLKPYRIFSRRRIRLEGRIKKSAHRHSGSWTSRGGLSIAFVGADGSGKSSSVDEIGTWLDWKLSVARAYMGLPKNNLWKITNRLDAFTARKKWVGINNAIVISKWLFAAELRYRTYLKFQMKKNQGNIVLFDRYPLIELWGSEKPMDGPRLTGFGKWEALEKKIYRKIPLPDYVVFLKVTLDEAIHRKNDPGSTLQKNLAVKVESIDRLIHKQKDNFIVIDTSKGRKQTLLEIKRTVWSHL